MMKLRTASFSLIFLLSGFAPALAQGSPPEPTEPPSRLSMFVHDVTDWVDHITTDANQITPGADHISTDDHPATDAAHVPSRAERHRTPHPPRLPRPRPPKLASAVASNQELSEFAPAPVASKKKTPTP